MKLQGLWNIINREVRLATNDIDIIMIAMIVPLFYSIFYGTLYWNKGERDIPVVAVDMDQSVTSKMLTRQLDAHQFIHIDEVTSDLGYAQDRVEHFKVQGAIFIPAGFEASLKKGKGADIKMYLNTTRFLVSNDINKGVTEVVLTMNAGIRLRYFQMQGYSFEQAKEMVEPLHIDVKPMFNTTETYGDFLIPAILIIILQQALLMALAESFAKEREEKTLAEAFTLAHKSIWGLMNGKSIFYGVLFLGYALFFYAVEFALFSLPFRGNPISFALLTVVFIAAVTAVGMFIGSFFKRKIIALQILGFTSYPIFFTTGYSWPDISLPLPIHYLAQVFPMTPFLSGANRMIAMGASWSDVSGEFIQLSLIAIVAFVAAYWRMNSIVHKELN